MRRLSSIVCLWTPQRWLLTGILTVGFSTTVSAQQAPERFRQVDRNGDGQLSRDEVNGPAFDEMDADKDESVSVQEAVDWARRTGFGQPNNRPQPNRRMASGESRRGSSDESSAAGQSMPALRIERNLDYAGTGLAAHRLDLLIPESPSANKPLPLVVFIHGGGWESGNRDAGRRFLTPLLQTGRFAAASIEYRLSREAIWPAQIHDCKAAIRWLRAHADEYGYDATQIAVVGESAGGHLVSMLGVTNQDKALEGSVGQHLKVSSDVNCVVDFYGPSNLKQMGDAVGDAVSPISKLLGGSTLAKPDLALEASPLTHVDKDDVAFFIIHGTADSVVPIEQSEQLHRALTADKVPSYFVQVTGGQHGGFRNPEINARAIAFLDRYLRGQSVELDDSPISP